MVLFLLRVFDRGKGSRDDGFGDVLTSDDEAAGVFDGAGKALGPGVLPDDDRGGRAGCDLFGQQVNVFGAEQVDGIVVESGKLWCVDAGVLDFELGHAPVLTLGDEGEIEHADRVVVHQFSEGWGDLTIKLASRKREDGDFYGAHRHSQVGVTP